MGHFYNVLPRWTKRDEQWYINSTPAMYWGYLPAIPAWTVVSYHTTFSSTYDPSTITPCHPLSHTLKSLSTYRRHSWRALVTLEALRDVICVGDLHDRLDGAGGVRMVRA